MEKYERDRLFDKILKNAVDRTKSKYPDNLDYKDSYGEVHSMSSFEVFSNLGDRMARNGIITNDNSVSSERRNASRASAFMLSVINSVYATDMIHDSIDEEFNDPEHKNAFSRMNEQEMQDLKKELKEYVTETLAVKAKTDEGKKFVQTITEEYNKTASYKNDPGMRSAIEKEGLFEENSNDLVMGGTMTVYKLNDQMNPNYTVSETLSDLNRYKNSTNKYEKIILDTLEKDSAALASEEEIYSQTVHNLNITVGKDQTVKPTEFLEHYKNKSLSNEEMLWANSIYNNEIRDSIPDLRDVMLDGKPMFTQRQIDDTTIDIDLRVAVVAEALAGKEVTVKDKDNEKLTLISPKINEAAENKSKSFWERITEFFSNLLNRAERKMEKAKMDDMKENISTTRNDFNNKKKLREKISFSELSGKNSLDKLNTSPSRQNNLTKTKNSPSMGK